MTHRPQRDSYWRTRGLPYIARFPRYLYGERVLNGVKVVLADSPSVVQQNFPNVMTDYVTPDFAQRRDSGEIVMSPMRRVYTQWTGSDGGFKVRSSNTANYELWEERSNAGPIYFGPPVAHPGYISLPNLRNYVATKTLAAVKPTNFQGLVALAESKKTLAQLANPLASMVGLLQYVTQLRQAKKNLRIDVVDGYYRRINGRLFRVRWNKWKGPGRIVQPPKSSIIVPVGGAISGTVLAYNLGLRPFLMDVESVIKEIPQAHRSARQTYRASDKETERFEETRTYKSGGYTFTARVVTERSVTVRGVAVAKDYFNVMQDFGVSLSDVPEALWELLPYSFLVDYLLNIGDYISAQRAMLTQTIEAACLSTVIDTTVTRTWLSTSLPGWIVERALVGSDILTSVEKTRESGLGQPALAYVPKTKAFSAPHIQNMLSLICQYLTGLAKPGRATKPFY